MAKTHHTFYLILPLLNTDVFFPGTCSDNAYHLGYGMCIWAVWTSCGVWVRAILCKITIFTFMLSTQKLWVLHFIHILFTLEKINPPFSKFPSCSLVG